MAIESNKPILGRSVLGMIQKVEKVCWSCGKNYRYNKSLTKHLQTHIDNINKSKIIDKRAVLEIGYTSKLKDFF